MHFDGMSKTAARPARKWGAAYMGFCLALGMLAVKSSRCEDPVPPFVAGFDRFARHGDIDERAAGRLLLAELSCTACHPSERPEMAAKRGPNLDGAGDRLQLEWMRRFLAAPREVKPGTTMPDVLHGLGDKEKRQAVEAIAAFLSTQHAPFPEPRASGSNPLPHEFWRKGESDRGRRLYHTVGCVACHEPDAEYDGGSPDVSPLDRLLAQLDPAEIEEMGLSAAARPVRSVPQGDPAAKYTPRSLTFFLLDPAATRTGGRMPSLKLSPIEAADITSWLLRDQALDAPDEDVPAKPAAPLVEEGRRLFAELRCAGCHSVKGTGTMPPALPFARLDPGAERSCLAAPRSDQPRFALDPAQADAVRAALADESQVSAGEQLELAMLRLNCYACHQRDKRGGVGRDRRSYFETAGHVDLGDEGRFPPPLSGAGRKLREPWLKNVLDGTGDVRPYMLARMPKFPAEVVQPLPGLLAAADGRSPATEDELFGDRTGLAAAGRTLLDSGCVQCHPIRGESLPGAVGVDLAGAENRLHPDWFREFLLEPIRLYPRTRMPTFFPGGKASNEEVLEGDVDRQIAAIWAYLSDLDNQPLPEKIVQARAADFELVPRGRPIVLRTFLEGAGTHAIAVGFPAAVHLAFDAETVHVALAWRGRFLDAHGTWFDRFAPPAAPLGEQVVALPAGVPLASLSNDAQPWPQEKKAHCRFMGYRLDRQGVPTFLYRLPHFDVEDRLEPSERGGLNRRLLIRRRGTSGGEDQRLWFRAHTAETLVLREDGECCEPDELTVIVAGEIGRGGKIRELDGRMEWIIPVELDVDEEESLLDVEYQW